METKWGFVLGMNLIILGFFVNSQTIVSKKEALNHTCSFPQSILFPNHYFTSLSFTSGMGQPYVMKVHKSFVFDKNIGLVRGDAIPAS